MAPVRPARWLICTLIGCAATWAMELADLLPQDPASYDKMRPPKKDNLPTTVYFHFTITGIDSIDEYSMTYTTDIFLGQSWTDHRLRLPENMTTISQLLEVDWLNSIWRPDSFFKNAKQVTFQTMTIPNHYLLLYRDNTILYMAKLTLTLSCSMNFVLYPHDTQECRIQIESLSHRTDDLIFDWDYYDPFYVNKRIQLPQLQLVGNFTNDCTHSYSTGNFTCLEVVFVLKRRLGYYFFHTYIPTCLIVIMSWISFWLHPEMAPARVTLGVTSLLTLSTQHAKSQAALPPVSYLKVVDAFMSICTIFVFMALMEYCLVNVVLGDNFGTPAATAGHRRRSPEDEEPAGSPSDQDQKTPVAGTSESTPCGGSVPSGGSEAPVAAVRPAELSYDQRARRRALQIDRFSRVFFPLSFAVLNLTYWIVFAVVEF